MTWFSGVYPINRKMENGKRKIYKFLTKIFKMDQNCSETISRGFRGWGTRSRYLKNMQIFRNMQILRKYANFWSKFLKMSPNCSEIISRGFSGTGNTIPLSKKNANFQKYANYEKICKFLTKIFKKWVQIAQKTSLGVFEDGENNPAI